ncbi:unnamed protein product [Symbiodinium microadriaticum]|nr:unnamed protein product [Symbiodinium sp. KB8]CAE7860786.1 unnamed protein product [Symbiodinium microadriaticum]
MGMTVLACGEDEPATALVPYHDDAALTKARNSTDATGLLLQHAEPRVAAGVAVFGLGVVALPLLEQCSEGDSLLSEAEQRSRLGVLQPSTIALEIQKDWGEFNSEPSERSDLSEEVSALQRWRDQALESVAALERRSALAFLGLGADAEPEAVHRSYKQKALSVHPDKGGSEEDFQQLQLMLERIHVPTEEETSSGGLFGMNGLLKHCKEAQQAREDAEADGLPEATKLAQRRLKLHDDAVELWKRATEAQQQLECKSGVTLRLRLKTASGGAPPCLDLLRRHVDSFSDEVGLLAPGQAPAERLFCRFLRQGIELLAAAALADAPGALSLVAMYFTVPLVQAARKFGPCPSLERRCQALLRSLAEVPDKLDSFLNSMQEGLADREAAEWRGCDETKGGVPTKGVDNVNTHDALPTPPLTRQCPFAAAVAAAGPGAPEAEVPQPPRKPVEPPQALQRRSEESQLKKQPLRQRDKYQDTEDWRKLRAFCIRARFCVNFNRDSEDVRCTLPADQCGYKHACAICGAEDRGGPGAQYQSHGGWNCLQLPAWLMAHGAS